MIIFYNKKTGLVSGTIDGRIHGEDHLKMWVGDKKENGRVIIQWKPVRWFDKDGKEVPEKFEKKTSADYEPDVKFKELAAAFDRKEERPTNYKVKLNAKGEVEGFEKK